jgi:hypothetical protein
VVWQYDLDDLALHVKTKMENVASQCDNAVLLPCKIANTFCDIVISPSKYITLSQSHMK